MVVQRETVYALERGRSGRVTTAIDKRIDGLRLRREQIRFRDNAALERWLSGLANADVREIGASRSGQAMYGLTVGEGPVNVSIIAGSHADEPIGPATAQLFPIILPEAFPELLDRYTFRIIPQMNPDGADANRVWFSDPPDFEQYSKYAIRELPGDDIEFGFGEGGRPENIAAMQLLKERAPYAAHFSLHGMAFAEGAWFLICREWANRAGGLMDNIEGFVRRMQFPLHDIERNGEKGFTRIRPGFCTTPNSVAMREHFEALNDPDTAAKFLPSSMEYIQSLGGNPLCVVTELPLFGIGKRSPTLTESTSRTFGDELNRVRTKSGSELDEALLDLSFRYELGPVSVQFQVRAQIAAIVYALEWLSEYS